MEQSNETRQLLEEIRDLQREYLAEYKRVTQQFMESNKINSENAAAQYRASFKQGQSSWLAIVVMVAVCIFANFLMCITIASQLDKIGSVVTRAMKRK